MLLNNHITKLLLAFVFGILLASKLDIHWVVYFTLWSTTIIALLTAIHFGRGTIMLRKTISTLLLLVFFLSGSFSYQYHLPHSQDQHYTRKFLSGDKLLVTIKDIDQDTTGYRKMIAQVDGIIRKNKHDGTVGKLLCYIKSDLGLGTGDQLVIAPKLVAIDNKGNPGEFNAATYWKHRGINKMSFLRSNDVKIVAKGVGFTTFWSSARALFKKILTQHLSSQNVDVAIALVLGDKSGLSHETRSIYANAGAMHVLAVSGMHVGILLGFLQWIFYRIPWLRKRNLYILFALIFVWGFAFLTGLSASVFRATLMFSILALGQLRGYSFFSLNALMVSALFILFVDPSALFHIGFQLSFLAMLGISFFFGPLRNLVNSRWKLINYFWDGTALGIAAQIGTIPVSLFYFHQFPNYFLLTNLGLLVLAGVSLVSVFILLLFSWLPVISKVLGYIVDVLFSILNGFIEFINNLPGTISSGYDPSWLWVVSVYISLVFIIYSWRRRLIKPFFAGLLAVFLLGSFLIFKREEHRLSHSLILLNHKYKVVLIKAPDKLVCLYPSQETKISDAKFLTEGASKIYGVSPSFIPYRESDRVVLSDEVSVDSYGSDLLINYYKKKICFTSRVNVENTIDGAEVVPQRVLHDSSWAISRREASQLNDK